MEQLVARRAHNPEAVGSNPAPATKKSHPRQNASGLLITTYPSDCNGYGDLPPVHVSEVRCTQMALKPVYVQLRLDIKNKSHISPIVINLVKGHRLFLVEMCSGNHEFPDHEKNGLNLDFLLLMSFTFIHEFPFFKMKQQAGNCFTKYLQRREKQFPEKQFFCLLGNHNECATWILKDLQDGTSHMTSKKSNLGIHDVSEHLNREIDSRLDQIIFNLGIRNVDKQHKAIGASVMKEKVY